MLEVNWIAVGLCAFSSLGLGGIWYSPMLFAKAWQQGAGLSDDELKSGNMAKIFSLTFVLSFIAAAVFAMFLGTMPLAGAVGAGFAAGLCWVGASYGINYLFERRSFALWAINAGYHTLQFTLFGLILGAMH
jgi:hypothetical protein